MAMSQQPRPHASHDTVSGIVLVEYKNVAEVENDVIHYSLVHMQASVTNLLTIRVVFLPELQNIWYFGLPVYSW